MRISLKTMPLVLVLVLCAGCPSGQYRFTNADLSGSGLRGGLYDLLPTAAGNTDTQLVSETPREVVEPDVIRRDGNTLYVLNQYRGLMIISLDEQKITAQVPTYGYPRDLYVVGDRAYVIVAAASDYKVDENKVTYTVASRLYVVDLNNPQNPDMPRFDLKGDLVDSRLVGDVLYAVCAEYQWSYVGGGAIAVPSVGGTVTVAKDQISSSWVTSINVADPNNIHQAAEVSFAGMGSVIQATNFAIFVAAPDWQSNTTTITYVDISDPAGAITVAGNIPVAGYVADKFKMDAYQGVLRVVSNDWNWNNGRKNFITTVSLADPNKLEVLGHTELEDASGETLFATRFDGSRAYIVTYLVKDPLFVLDLSDPTNPKVAGKLVVPGWSTYIEPQGNRLIALGVDDTNGRRVSVSMFDVTDAVAPVQIGDKATFGDNWSWSDAYSDVKSFTVLDNVLIVPFSGWTNAGGYDRLQFVSYGDAGLALRGYVDVTGTVLRSFEYGDRYYGVTSEQLSIINGSDLDQPTVEKSLALAENVVNFFELPPSEKAPAANVEVISQYNSTKTIVRTVDAEGAPLGEASVDIGSLAKAYVYGQSVVLVGTAYDSTDYHSYYLVDKVDCSTSASPSAAPVIKVDVTPYWSYWYAYGGGPLMDVTAPVGATNAVPGSEGSAPGRASAGKALMSAYWMPWWTPQNVTFLLGDILALRCSGDHFDTVFGGNTASQGLALVNLATQKWTTTVGLAFDSVVSMDAVQDKLYIGTQQSAGMNMLQPLMANFLRIFNPQTMVMGPGVNIPGQFLQYDPATHVLVVRDDQWGGNWTLWYGWGLKTNLHSLTWDGGLVLASRDELVLPDGISTIMARGAKIYMDVQPGSVSVPVAAGLDAAPAKDQTGYFLYAASVSSNGRLSLSDGFQATDQWATLFDAHGDTAYVTIGNAVAVYDFSGDGALKDLFETMGYPASMYFGTDGAYVALGYTGVAKLPL